MFDLSDTTVTVSIATVPTYAPVKTEGPHHGHEFSVTVPNNCNETEGHVGVFNRHLPQNTVQCSPSTQARTPPDSTFTEGFKDGSQEVSVSVRPLSFTFLLSYQTIEFSPDPTEPGVGSAFPGFI